MSFLIIDYETYKSTNLFEKDVLTVIENTNVPFSYYKEYFDALIVLKRNPQFFIFISYIPAGHLTHLPTISDSMQNLQGTPRTSTGEWVVDIIYQCEELDAKVIFNLLENNQDVDSVIRFIRTELEKP